MFRAAVANVLVFMSAVIASAQTVPQKPGPLDNLVPTPNPVTTPVQSDAGAEGQWRRAMRERYEGKFPGPAPRTPEWTAALGATYQWNLGNGSSLSLRGDATYQSKMFFGTDPINGFQDAHTLVDARLTWESPDRGWSMSLFGTNLTDEVYFHGMLSLVTVLGREQGNVARPSEWGLALKRSF